MLARNRIADGHEAHEAFAQTLRRNNGFPADRAERPETIDNLGLSALQAVTGSLEGPQGLHAPTLFVALGALAGYAAKWAVALDIADGRVSDDFRLQPGEGRRSVVYSDHVRDLVAGLSRQSALSIVLGAATRANASSFAKLEALTHRAILPGRANAMPDYSVEARHFPQFAPEALLMMLWENIGRTFRAERRPRGDLALGLAFAAAHALSAWRSELSVETAATLFVESALAMSKIDRAF
ncbi:MAG: hypothetical protein IPL47_00040 [Phyllobacteriaceae bacterium]|nr:hypothetical protein [Phyllobacteriaceae bacterium]